MASDDRRDPGLNMNDRAQLPQLSGRTFITDGGMETDLIFRAGLELPHFASFVLLENERGVQTLRDYYLPYIEIARDQRVGIILDTPTWRANADWGARLGYSPEALAALNRRGVALLEELRASAGDEPALVISGCLGPRGDGYRADQRMSDAEAAQYHAPQIATFADTAADMISALTLTYADEAVGIVRAAEAAAIPAVVSFTLETDGRLPSGQALHEAIEQVDAETAGAAAYFMVNCAHPTHFADALKDVGPSLDRIRGLRANASAKSHAELDEAEELDEGDPVELAQHYRGLVPRLRNLTVVGGCCGTDHRHIAAICAAWAG
jgi:S-methylmethionine-dependent homocysteine/selenocysteine methylase